MKRALTAAAPEPRSDAELLEAVRSGDTDAFGDLFERHYPFAERVARSRVPDGEQDVASEAFLAIYQKLINGTGPTQDFRSYLRRVVTNKAIDWYRQAKHTSLTSSFDEWHAPVPDHASRWFEVSTIVRAYRRLPAHAKRVLWQVEIEGRAPRDLSQSEGRTPAQISRASYRARRALRIAYLDACVGPQTGMPVTCRPIHRMLPDHIGGNLSRRRQEELRLHLHSCRDCLNLHVELVGIDQELGAPSRPASSA